MMLWWQIVGVMAAAISAYFLMEFAVIETQKLLNNRRERYNRVNKDLL